ncbi:MAG: hypothetical protein IJ874_06840 [Ruminococcus sp.]|nr:hypothetical protein [Ruminococcus sp.]
MNKIRSTADKMRLVIPAMLLCMIGDYCIGIEPKNAEPLGTIASTGWLTIADLRIAVSDFTGAVGSILYAIGAAAFIRWLSDTVQPQTRAGRIWLRLYIAGLGVGCVSFLYFHIACGGLIHHFKVLYEITGGDLTQTTDAWLRMFMPEAVPFFLLFIVFDAVTSAAWAALILLRILPVRKWWIMAAPLITAGIGAVLELIPLPFSGIGSGFESLGWMLMFVCGIFYIEQEST